MEEKFKLIEKISEKNIDKNGKPSYRYYEIIECIDCGHQIKITSGDKKRKESCKMCNLKKHKEDFVGFENHLFIVTNFNKQIGKKLYYDVTCKKCNMITTMRKDAITNTNAKVCINCKSNGVKPSTDVALNVFMSIYKTGAKNRGFDWDLTNKQFEKITKQNCYFCGSKPIEQKSLERYYHESIKDRIKFNGIDRLDSNLGYTEDNCVPCCTMCNRMKLDYTENDFLNHISKILEHQNSIKCSTTIETTSDKDGKE